MQVRIYPYHPLPLLGLILHHHDLKGTTDDVAKIVIAKYPHLRAYLSTKKRSGRSFICNMFDAIGLGIIAEIISKNVKS